MTAPSQQAPAATALIANYARQVAQIRQRVTDFAVKTWRRLGTYNRDDVNRLVKAVVPLVEQQQLQIAQLTDAYLSALYAQLAGESAAPVAVAPLVYSQMRKGVQPAEVYQRPFIKVWTSLKDGQDLSASITHGENRLKDLVVTDLQLAKTHTSQQVLSEQPHVVGYRRVLEGAYSCGLCILASTQRYHKQDLMPIHPGCDCAVAPVIGDHDPGQVLNDQAVSDVHAAVRKEFGTYDPGGRAIDYRKFLVTHEHGELGPILARKVKD